MRTLDRAALWLMHATVVSSIVMQIGKGDFLPPKVSMSQYGVGPFGWTFTITLILLAAGSMTMAIADLRRFPPPPRAVTILIAIWAVGVVLTGLVPADPDQSIPTLAGRAHTLFASLALIVLPIAAVIRVTMARRQPPKPLRITICVLAFASELSLGLLVLAATGIDITGLGPHSAWALYESSSVVLDVVLIYLMCMVARISVVVPARAEVVARTSMP
ncbi:uncharacterized protein DUF998 [Antricoccus suffuscus]|uniref:Uncharacterized protein DUF998 n=1 Tax=Antricoccus suffuscus TaxID=1629062 RepID=A0A2T1A2L3_9ACTN|nr:uncharacterized protein DUF998 [Antricoccus suffuscus]